MTAIEQIAGAGAIGENFGHGLNGAFEAVEHQKGDRTMARQRLRGDRRLGNERQRALGAAQQAAEIEMRFR